MSYINTNSKISKDLNGFSRGANTSNLQIASFLTEFLCISMFITQPAIYRVMK